MGNNQPRPTTKVILKNKSAYRLKVKIDCDRKLNSIVMNSVKLDLNVEMFGGKGTFKNTNEYEAYYVVDTSSSFCLINPHEQKSFFLFDGTDIHAFMTIMTENDDSK